jgi:hypothetical protein
LICAAPVGDYRAVEHLISPGLPHPLAEEGEALDGLDAEHDRTCRSATSPP